MDFMVPQHGEFLDDVVRHCETEFDHTLSDEMRTYPGYWRYAVKHFTSFGFTPGGGEVDDETWLSLCYPNCALYLTEGDELLGFIHYNQFRFIGDMTVPLEVLASGELRREGSIQRSTYRKHEALTARYVPGYRAMRELALTLPPGGRGEAGIETFDEDDGYIALLVVGKAHRGRGYAPLLLNECCRRLAVRGVERVFSHAANPASVRAHSKAGFEQLLYIEPFYSDLGGTTLMGRDLARLEDDG